MRLSHIENRIDQQRDLAKVIVSAYENLIAVGYENVTRHRIEARLASLREHWEKFSLNHDAINLSVDRLSSRDRQKVRENSYFKNEKFETILESYLNTVEKMKSLREKDQSIARRSPSNYSQSSNSQATQVFHAPRLPRIDLPKFNGTPSEWLSFKDLFSSLVLSNAVLSSVEKLQYLKTSLVGPAANLLKNTALTNDNFQKAWDALISFYENKRLLVNSALHSLVNMKRMTKESSSEMEQLYTTIMQIYRTLETLQRPVETWDDILIFMTVQRLDAESVKAWEHHLGSSKELPTWKQFSEFLMTRMLSLQAFEKSRIGKSLTPTSQNLIKSYYSGQDNKQKDNSFHCPLCTEQHLLFKCPEYNNKTVQQRLDYITKNNRCYNCLNRHRVSTCQSLKRCNKCGKKHHSTIHRAESSKENQPKETTTTANETAATMLHS